MARSLWRSTLVFSAMTMLSRIMGLVRDISLASVFGASGMMDAFWVAFRIPNFFRRLFAEGAFSQAFVPVLSEYKTTREHEDIQILISRVAGALISILSVLTVVAVLAAPWIIEVFAPGFRHEPEKLHVAVSLLQITFPYLLLISLTAFAGSVLNSYGAFASASFSPVLLNVCMILAAWVIAPHMDPPVMALGWAVLVAGFLQLFWQLPELFKRRLLIWPKPDFQHEGVRRILKLMLPALFGVSVVQLNLLLNTVWASFMQSGSISWMTTAERLTELPLGLIGVAIGSVILPSLSASHATKNMQQFRAVMDWAVRVILLVGIPASIAIFMLSGPLIQTLFQHGRFTAADTQMTALSLQAMALSILAFMLIKVFAPGYFAQQDTRTPVKIGLIAVATNIICSAGLVLLFRQQQLPQHVALSAASTIAALVNASLLYAGLKRRGIFSFTRQWRKPAMAYLAGNTAMIITLYFGLMLYHGTDSFLPRLLTLLGLCVAGGAAYGAGVVAAGMRPRHLKATGLGQD